MNLSGSQQSSQLSEEVSSTFVVGVKILNTKLHVCDSCRSKTNLTTEEIKILLHFFLHLRFS